MSSLPFPTLLVVPEWIEAHCVVPDGFDKGRPFVMYDWQLWCTLNHYRVKSDAEVGQLAPAFHYRRSQVVGPQKTGKGPWAATIIADEAVGPAVFDGFAGKDDGYVCADHGCGCGWEYGYDQGEPMGIPWPTPLIQLTATSEDQTDNVFRPLQSMVKNGPLADLMRVGEEFIRCPNDGKIETVTSSSLSRLGNPIIFALQDESGLYTDQNKLRRVAETQRRGAAGMGGRSMETTNPWDPAENSVAQRTFGTRRPDVFKFYRQPPAGLRFEVKADRRKIFAFNYHDSPHVDVDAVEAEAAELMEEDPQQAERFFGNRVVQGAGSYYAAGEWQSFQQVREVRPGETVCLGFDGSDVDDWTAIRLEAHDGYRFTPLYGPDSRPTVWNPAEWGGQVPRDEVHAAVDEICRTYDVKFAYCDPPDWWSEIGDWSVKYGEKTFFEWWTNRVPAMFEALKQSLLDYRTGRSKHDDCKLAEICAENARKRARPSQRYILGKPAHHQKIDVTMADVLAHKAAMDAHADGWEAEHTPAIPRRIR